jgi:hypothetical protein
MTVFRDLSQHILDIAENSINANATRLYIDIVEDFTADRLSIIVRDNGYGMDAQTLSQISDPWTTTRTTRKVGLGIPFLKQTAEMCAGDFTITSQPNIGTTTKAVLQHSHIDRPPIGDLVGTLLCIIVGNTKIDLHYHHTIENREFMFDTAEIRQVLGDEVPLSDPEVLGYIREALEQGWQALQSEQA